MPVEQTFGNYTQDEALAMLGIPDAKDPKLAAIAALSWGGAGLKVLRVNAAENGWELAAIAVIAEPPIAAGTTGQYWRGDKSWQTLNQAAVAGLGTADSPQFAGVNIGHASDTTIARTGAGDIAVEGNQIYRAAGTDVAVADGGTGASTAAAARTNLGLVIGTDVEAHAAMLAAFAAVAWSAGVQIPALTAANTFALKTVGSAAGNILDKTAGDALYQPVDSDLTTWAGITPGTGVAAALANNIGSTGALIPLNGAGGTPSSLTLTNAAGLPITGLTASTSSAIGVGSIELGHASDTTIARTGAGDIAVEGNQIYRAAGTDVAVADGGTGASTASGARTNLGLGTAATMAGPTGTIVGTSDSQTLTNKTLTAPIIATITNTGTLTLPTSTDTIVGRATTDTLSNKTFSGATAFPGNTAITSGGRILGKSTTGNYHTLAESNAGDYAAQVKNDSASDGYGLLVTSAAASATSFSFIDGYSSWGGTPSKRFSILGNGNLLNANGVYGSLSDGRIKTCILPAGPQWDDVHALSHAMSSFVLEGDPDGRRQLGAVAQHWEAISPGLIDHHVETAIDESGAPVPTGRVLRSIKTSVAQLKLFKAAGEMMDRIVALERELAALKGAAGAVEG